MSKVIFEKLLILGVGLIGGSLAMAAKQAGAVGEVRGWGRRQSSLDEALALGVIEQAETDLKSALDGVDCVVVATPTQFAAQLMVDVVQRVPASVVVTDVASVKGNIAAALAKQFGEVPANVVLGHPIAGSEQSGVAAARADLFVGQRVILAAQEQTAPAALQAIESLWRATGAELHAMSVEFHDEVLGMTSHLPHLLAYALVAYLSNQPSSSDIFALTGGGFRDFTRIAGSDPRMWREISVANDKALLEAISGFEKQLAELKKNITDSNGPVLEALFAQAKAARDHHMG